MTFLIVFLVFGGMVVLHELGHFFAAKLMKIEVEEFGFGLPPKVATLFKWQGTEFTLNALPLGGFVRPKGENDPEIPDGLANANPWKRIFVLVAGPLMNFATAILVVALIVGQTGISVPGKVIISEVVAGSPAEDAGFLVGDVILMIDGDAVDTPGDSTAIIRSHLDESITILVDRDGEQIEIEAMPLSSRNAQEGALGVSLGSPTRPATLPEMFMTGISFTGAQAMGILYMPVGLIKGVISPDEARFVGLKGIYDIFDQAVEKDVATRATESMPTGNTPGTPPTYYVLSMVAMLSTSLAVFNLLPIPALDGGRILFALPEIVLRKRIPYKLENVVNGIAYLLLIALMLVVNAMDFINPVNVKLP